MSAMTISATMLRHYTTCKRRIWLDAYGNRQHRNSVPSNVQFRRVQGMQHEREIINYSMPDREDITVTDWSEAVAVTHELMAHNTKRIAGAAFETTILLNSVPDAIRLVGQIDQLVALRDGYAVVEIKQRQRLNPADELQMDLYVWLVEQITGQQPRAEFWMGVRAGRTRYQPVAHIYDEMRLMATLEDVAQVLHRNDHEPEALIASHCDGCPWHDYCSTRAKTHLSLSLLNGIRERTIDDMHRAGYQSLNQLMDLQPDDLTQFYGIKTTALRYHAQIRAWVENQPILYGSVHEDCYKDAWFFDIETNPSTGAVWSIGWSKSNRQTEAIIVAPHRAATQQVLADGHRIHYVQDDMRAWEFFYDAVSVDDMPIFAWTGFDAGVMASAVPHLHETLHPRLIDLCNVFSQAVQIPRKGVSLKVVAPYLGFTWRAYPDWFQAWVDYQNWLDSDNETQLVQLSQYQTDDVLAMIVINDWLLDISGQNRGNNV